MPIVVDVDLTAALQVVLARLGVSSVGVSLLPPLTPGSEPAAATPAKTRIALMMIAAFVMSFTPSEWSNFVSTDSRSALQALGRPRQSLGKA